MKRRAILIALAAAATAVVVKLCRSKHNYLDTVPPDPTHPADQPPNPPTGPK